MRAPVTPFSNQHNIFHSFPLISSEVLSTYISYFILYPATNSRQLLKLHETKYKNFLSIFTAKLEGMKITGN